jgi:hypothetical protein
MAEQCCRCNAEAVLFLGRERGPARPLCAGHALEELERGSAGSCIACGGPTLDGGAARVCARHDPGR